LLFHGGVFGVRGESFCEHRWLIEIGPTLDDASL
jgi:hypothetical protein